MENRRERTWSIRWRIYVQVPALSNHIMTKKKKKNKNNWFGKQWKVIHEPAWTCSFPASFYASSLGLKSLNQSFCLLLLKFLWAVFLFLRVYLSSMTIRAFGGYLPPAKLLLSKNKLVNSKSFTELYLGYGVHKGLGNL